MKAAVVLFIVAFLLVFSPSFAKKDRSTTRKTDTKKEEKDRQAAAARVSQIASLLTHSSLIPLSDRNFSKFVVDRPRYYHAALMFTASNPRYQCNVCMPSKAIYTEAAEFSRSQLDFNTSEPSNRIVFFILEVDSAREIFQEMGLETVPRTYILPPRDLSDPKIDIERYETDVRNLLQGPAQFLDVVNEMTGLKVIFLVSNTLVLRS